MSDQTPSRPKVVAKRGSLGQSLLTVAAAATTSAAVIWSALFYNATNRHADAVAGVPASIAQGAPARGTVQAAPAPVSTRTS